MTKELQCPLTVDQQLENLKSLNLLIENEENAKSILNDISYFRLVKGFGLGLKPKNGCYNGLVSFGQIVDLYKFNANVRQLIFTLVERIEVNLRCRIANYFSVQYGVLGYLNVDNFADAEYHREFLDDIWQEIDRNSKSPFVRNFQEHYNGQIPMYALVELFSFGTLSKFYKNMKNPDKKEVAALYGAGYTYLESWIESVAYLRNLCAHYGRIYNAKIPKRPMLYKQDVAIGVDNGSFFGVLVCMARLLPHDIHWRDLLDQLELLIEKYPVVDIQRIGFPMDWKSILQ